jgi:Uma2 family endonuclease
VILKTNPGQLTAAAMIGPADICIEVVAPESVTRDYGEEFEEYEKAGVREYWIIDPLRRETNFHRLQDTGLYARAHLDHQDTYRTPLLPGLALHVPTLWADPLPGVLATAQAVQTMLKAE